MEIISIVGSVERLKKLLTELREVKAVLGVSFSLFPVTEG